VTAFYIAISDPENGEFATAYGDASTEGPAATIDDSFRIGSISKTFTATIILQLVQSGAIALDDTVGELLPDLAAEHPEIETRTVEQLLAMNSGIADYLNKVDTVVPVVVEDPSKVWAPEELVAAGVEAGVTEPPEPGYSTTNYIILQLIAESVTESSLQDLIAEQIAAPLELEGVYLPPNDDTTLPEPATHGYIDGGCLDEMAEDGAQVEAGTDTTDWNASYGQGGGGMTSTVSGLLDWAASGTGNSLLDDATVDQRLAVEVLPEGISYGLGIMEVGRWVGHEGEAIGWEALAVKDLQTGTSLAVAANGCGGLFDGFLGVMLTLYPESMLVE
jgi:D-alanyl-D-alanine carboxypeptidase